jgi:cephalosporin hydroxylase
MSFKPPHPAQHLHELYQFIGFLKARNVKSYIEVGVRHGGTLFRVATSMPKGSLIVAIDQPNGVWGADSETELKNVIDRLNFLGYDARMILGDSSSEEIVNKVKEIRQRFDAVFIDGDHRYDGVYKDYKAYSPMCDLVAFHDIAGYGCRSVDNHCVEVPILWSEIKSDRNSCELIGENSRKGIGILYNKI